MARREISSASPCCSSRVESSVDISSMSTPPISAVAAPVDLASHDGYSIPPVDLSPYDGGPAEEVRDWCDICGRYDRCACPMPQPPPIQEPPPVCPVMWAPPRKAPPPVASMELSTSTRHVLVSPKMPKPEPKREAGAVPHGRITVVEPGDLNYATDGFPWSVVCSRCGVFRPFANVTEESCLNVIGIECAYEEAQQ